MVSIVRLFGYHENMEIVIQDMCSQGWRLLVGGGIDTAPPVAVDGFVGGDALHGGVGQLEDKALAGVAQGFHSGASG